MLLADKDSILVVSIIDLYHNYLDIIVSSKESKIIVIDLSILTGT